MQITISNQSGQENLMKKINKANKDVGTHLYRSLHRVLGAMDKSISFDEEGRHKYLHTWYFFDYDMTMSFSVGELCEEGRKIAQTFIEEVANFFEVEVSYIGDVSFNFF